MTWTQERMSNSMHLIDLKIKNVYRNKPSETESQRAVRIRAEQNLKNAWQKFRREAERANGNTLEKYLFAIDKGSPWQGKEQDLKLLLGRAEREVDKILAIEKANEIAQEMVRIKFATYAGKPKTPSSKGRRK